MPPSRATPGIPSTPGATPTRRPLQRSASGGRTAPRRRVAAKSSAEDDILHRFLIKAGIAVVVLALGGFGTHSAFSSSSPNQRYFDEFAKLSRTVGDGIAMNHEQLARKVNALPIGGVTDPKLQEVHQVLLSLLAFNADTANTESVERLKSQARRFDQLVDELNSKYAR
jgi:hypothetical protein